MSLVTKCSSSCNPPCTSGAGDILNTETIAFLEELHQRFSDARVRVLADHAEAQRRVDAGDLSSLAFAEVAGAPPDWTVAPLPGRLASRRVELVSAPTPKKIVKGLNSGADVYVADFDDALAPIWSNVLQGHRTVYHAVHGSLGEHVENGKKYVLKESGTHLFIRPRGLFLEERHLCLKAEPISASLFDIGLFLFHCAARLQADQREICIYLPKIESRAEAAWWNDLLAYCEKVLSLPENSLKVAVIVESIWAAFAIEPILYELRQRCAGVSSGRWDYLFSHIKTFIHNKKYRLPERSRINFESGMLSSLGSLVVAVARRRRTLAVGCMSAYIPSRKSGMRDQVKRQRFTKEKEDEVAQGFDSTWVAHPKLVKECAKIFTKPRDAEAPPTGADGFAPLQEPLSLLQTSSGKLTGASLKRSVRVSLHYFAEWILGEGAIRLDDRMEDTATAEICRSQVWQWLHEPGLFPGGAPSIEEIERLLAAQMPTEGNSERMKAFRISRRYLMEVWLNAEYCASFSKYLYARLPDEQAVRSL